MRGDVTRPVNVKAQLDPYLSRVKHLHFLGVKVQALEGPGYMAVPHPNPPPTQDSVPGLGKGAGVQHACHARAGEATCTQTRPLPHTLTWRAVCSGVRWTGGEENWRV
jgi:hypothetical protein